MCVLLSQARFVVHASSSVALGGSLESFLFFFLNYFKSLSALQRLIQMIRRLWVGGFRKWISEETYSCQFSLHRFDLTGSHFSYTPYKEGRCLCLSSSLHLFQMCLRLLDIKFKILSWCLPFILWVNHLITIFMYILDILYMNTHTCAL